MSLNFDKDNSQWVSIPWAGVTGSQNRTVCYWQKYTNFEAPHIFDSGNLLDPGRRFFTRYFSGLFFVGVRDGGRGWLRGNSADGTWRHVSVVLDGSTTSDFTAYTDAGTMTVSQTTTQTVNTGTDNNIMIGKDIQNVGLKYYDGNLKDFRMYNRALNHSEIKTIFNSRGNDNITNGLELRLLMNEKPFGITATVASSIIDISGNNRHGTPNNSPIYQESILRLTNPIISLLDEDVATNKNFYFNTPILKSKSLATEIYKSINYNSEIIKSKSFDTGITKNAYFNTKILKTKDFSTSIDE